MLVLFWMLTLLHFAQRIWTFVFSKSHTCLLISLSPFFFSESLKLLQIWWSVAVKSGVCAGQSVTFTLVFVVVKTKRRHRPSFAADFQNLHTSFVFHCSFHLDEIPSSSLISSDMLPIWIVSWSSLAYFSLAWRLFFFPESFFIWFYEV